MRYVYPSPWSLELLLFLYYNDYDEIDNKKVNEQIAGVVIII